MVNLTAQDNDADLPLQGQNEGARPADEQILDQQNAIRAETSTIPYVGDKEDMSCLKTEYQNGNFVFLKKIDSLQATYSSYRRTRGDGNCFYRAFLYRYLESLLDENNIPECRRFIECINGWRQKLVEAHFQELVFEDAMELLLEQVSTIGNNDNPMTKETLTINMRDDMVSNMMVMFLRMVTSAEIQRRSDFFAPFIMGMYDDVSCVEVFCQRSVEVMGEESDHVHIVALSDALQVPIAVVYLDRSNVNRVNEGSSEVEVETYHFNPEPGASVLRSCVSLLYRPGHYDILYQQ
ncbi:hypothetical protein CEUSTIGMA_g273.t1 [Chlamydomonas eustigma]|uniref:Ubiquitin thioesterase n=1 Tax=Chlamydomonas eustigma TaxID=1157962 RepID=A0A250WPR4_9CHLO|nr:hypothetical protein CEUSTIGMA_g273.t1 [Chlamydomonas eustigma]|eukprot:GAX72818.1 hypothetical protein CEUSTIGMA_g273.t1 [Chlamydomonas eustigma]